MLVGDPKQSIYRFRRADVTVWRRVEDDFTTRGLGRVLPLTDNFRSLPPILGFVEATVGQLLDQPIDGATLQPFEVPFLPVDARRDPVPPEAEPVVELLLAEPPDDEKVLADPLRAAEARAIAARALELHAAGTPWREMALLLPGWGLPRAVRVGARRGGGADLRPAH
ncbi:MAG: UvrD-helicase domain-containing protein [Gemmatimonadetes bacterium]|nr:UvrD-helicase domain-containing protein [Gemmatimonadota bacterium]